MEGAAITEVFQHTSSHSNRPTCRSSKTPVCQVSSMRTNQFTMQTALKCIRDQYGQIVCQVRDATLATKVRSSPITDIVNQLYAQRPLILIGRSILALQKLYSIHDFKTEGYAAYENMFVI